MTDTGGSQRRITREHEAGMVFAGAYDAYTMDEPNAQSERICVIFKEQGK